MGKILGNCSNCGRILCKEPAYQDADKQICASCYPYIELGLSIFTIDELLEMNKTHSLNNYEDHEEPEKIEEVKLTPKKIHEELDKFVVGQDEAKKILSVAAYNHFKKISSEKLDCVKSNILLMGPTGCGKTLLIKNLAKILGLPVVIADATQFTEAGYVGKDVEDILEDLFKAANEDLSAAERGIVFIDEIDKLRSGGRDVGGRDVSGSSVQQGLLKMIEGYETSIKVGSGMHSRKIAFDTSKVLFICSGSFAGLEEIVKKRKCKKGSIGFENSIEQEDIDANPLIYANTKDLKDFGMIPEFLGRLPIVACLKELTVDQLHKIIIEPKDSIAKQFEELFGKDNSKIKFTDGALKAIAKKAIENETGARGLRGIIERLLLNIMYELPEIEGDKTVIITKSNVEGKTDIVIRNNNKNNK